MHRSYRPRVRRPSRTRRARVSGMPAPRGRALPPASERSGQGARRARARAAAGPLLRRRCERNAGGGRGAAKADKTRQQTRQHAPAFRRLVTRCSAESLIDRPGRSSMRAMDFASAGRRDRVVVRAQIPLGIFRSLCRLAQHVVGETEIRLLARALERLADRFARNELLGHDLHGVADGPAHQRLARARHQPPHDGVRTAFAWCHSTSRRSASGPRRLRSSGDSRRSSPPNAHLRVCRESARRPSPHPECGAAPREAHQHHALARRKAVALQECFRPQRLRRSRAHRGGELARLPDDALALRAGKRQARAQRATAFASSSR